MTNSIKIENGRKGYYLTVSGMYISFSFSSDVNPVKAINCDNGIPYGATEWVSIEAIKRFWHKYMPIIIASTNRPYRSVWGQLEFKPL